MFSQRVSGEVVKLALVAFLTFSAPLPLEAKDFPGELAAKERAVRLLPASPWRLDAREDRCLLSRSFESSKGPGMVLFEQIAPGQRFDLTIAGPDIASARKGAWFYAGIRSDLVMETIDPLEYEVDGFGGAISLADVMINDDVSAPDESREPLKSTIDLASAALVERIVLQRSTTIISFELGGMTGPFEALNDCSRGLLRGWGLDEQAHRAPRLPDERTFFARFHHEYTNTPKNEGHDAILRVRVLVDRDGSVSDCYHEYLLSSGSVRPDVCTELEGLRFEPGTDSNGKSITSVYSRSVILSKYDPWTANAHGGRWGSVW